ncbi:MAG: molybdate ABC transporter substrate-binding protein [Propionibacteriales bacterium]|nr:molybdate ABC transporter substrate-binding protein [Propionibacteriales bacterium]
MTAVRRLTALAAAVAVVACGAGSGDRTELTVLAAASLTEAFTELEHAYEAEHPGVDVSLTFDSSATLAEQVVAGARADVLATADRRTMTRVVHADLADGRPEVFTTNTLVIITPQDDPGDVDAVSDLESADLTWSMCDPAAPCGAAAQRLLDVSDVRAQPDSLEEDVKAVLTRVRLGEVDTGIVYRSDARAAQDDVRTVDIPAADRVVNRYPITVVTGSEESGAAHDWVDLVMSPDGQKMLVSKGFGTP